MGHRLCRRCFVGTRFGWGKSCLEPPSAPNVDKMDAKVRLTPNHPVERLERVISGAVSEICTTCDRFTTPG